jgi:hypothetical protein
MAEGSGGLELAVKFAGSPGNIRMQEWQHGQLNIVMVAETGPPVDSRSCGCYKTDGKV